MKIQEIRMSSTDQGTAHIGNTICESFLSYMYGKYEMEKANIVVIDIHIRECDKKYYIHPISGGNIYNLKFIQMAIDKHYFLSLNDWEKLKLISQIIYEALLAWASYYILPTMPIEEAYQKIIHNNYFSESKKRYTSKNKKYTCWIVCRSEYTIDTYKLCFLRDGDSEVKYYLIISKPYPRTEYLLSLDIDTLLKVPQFLKVKGWLNNEEFEMYWGEQEKYIFNAENETIKTITNNAD